MEERCQEHVKSLRNMYNQLTVARRRHVAIYIWVNNGSGKGLLADGS